MKSPESGPDMTTADAVIRRAADDFPNEPQKQIDEILKYWQERAQELEQEARRTPLPENVDESTAAAEEFKNGEYVRLLAEDALVITLGERIDALRDEIVQKEIDAGSQAENRKREAELTKLRKSLEETRQLYERSGVDTDKTTAEIAEVDNQIAVLKR
jgi:hypothetical protein